MKNMPFFLNVKCREISWTVKWPFLFSLKRDLLPHFITLNNGVATGNKSRERAILFSLQLYDIFIIF